ncbi:FIBA-like protein [Mya arenaria]|uniref:FIBA-like protein n=1 Tax=Mya arenaria TaxID=6604 RepID=A0ABY7F9J9_MYAAR|nr:FIBA-like protein [Mya arenaria]
MTGGSEVGVTDCLDVQRLHPSSPDGVYRVTLWKSQTAISVYCDMTSSNGGWTVFQNRYDGSEEFYLDLKAYTEGFGNTLAEFWLGLRYIKELADQGNSTLRMEVSAADGSEAYEEWPDFRLGDAPGYKLHVGGNGTGTAGDDSLYFSRFQNGTNFTAKGSTCGNKRRGGWWYDECTLINLNGHYASPGTDSGG